MRARLTWILLATAMLACSRGSEPGPSPAKSEQPAPEPVEQAMAKPPEPNAESNTAEPDPAEPKAGAPTCIAQYEFGEGSVLAEQRRRGGAARWDDFAERYPAAYLDPDADRPVEAVESFTIGETPLLWFRPDFSEAVVNAAVLSELKVVNVTMLGAGQREVVGSLTELGQGKIEGRALAHFLLRADALLSYVHIGSQVCLVSESTDTEGNYRAHYTGEHTYFTNEENVDAFAFEFELGADGQFAVTGGSA